MKDSTKHKAAYAVAIIAAFGVVLLVAWFDQKYNAPRMKQAIEFQQRLMHHKK